MSLKDVERTLNKVRTADSNALRKGSVLPTAGNATVLETPYTPFTAREQRRTTIMTDIARLAQQPLQRSMPGASPYSTLHHVFRHVCNMSPRLHSLVPAGKDGSPSPSSAVTMSSAQYVLSHTWNPTDLFSRYGSQRRALGITLIFFYIISRTDSHSSPSCSIACSLKLVNPRLQRAVHL